MMKLFGQTDKALNGNGDVFGFQVSWDTED